MAAAICDSRTNRCAERLVVDQHGRQDLERDLAREAQLLGAIDDAHAAAPDDRLDAVWAEVGADAWIG